MAQSPDPQKPDSNTGFIAVIGSVIAALFGIQSNAKRQRDFKKGDAADFIVVAIVGAVLLVLGMILLVNHVLSE